MERRNAQLVARFHIHVRGIKITDLLFIAALGEITGRGTISTRL